MFCCVCRFAVEISLTSSGRGVVHSNECVCSLACVTIQCVALYREAQKYVNRAHYLALTEICRLKPVTGTNHLHASFIIQLLPYFGKFSK